MSSDVMVICKEDNSSFMGKETLSADTKGMDKALFIDEASMGEPHSAFGKWFVKRYCTASSMIEQLQGIKEHRYMLFTSSDLKGIEDAIDKLETHKKLDKSNVIQWLQDHISKHISTENW